MKRSIVLPDQCTSDDTTNHQGDTCPVHEAPVTVEGPGWSNLTTLQDLEDVQIEHDS